MFLQSTDRGREIMTTIHDTRSKSNKWKEVDNRKISHKKKKDIHTVVTCNWLILCVELTSLCDAGQMKQTLA